MTPPAHDGVSPGRPAAPWDDMLVLGDDGSAGRVGELEVEATARGADVAAALERAPRLAAELPRPGGGRTATLLSGLAALAAGDLTVARVVEPHLDAVSILSEAGGAGEAARGLADADAVWAVWAAEAPGARLEAVRRDGGWRLTGTKPWCSLAGRVDAALVTAWTSDTERGLFACDARDAGVVPSAGGWHARGLADVVSSSVAFEDVGAVEVGSPGWYLERPGFAWGGIAVAACWFGGAVGLARALARAARRRDPDQLALAHLGAADRALTAGRLALADAAARIDAGSAQHTAGARLALRVRGIVADTAESVLVRVGHALGPAPLALDEEHARRVADLTLYLRQHHAERDDVALGRSLLTTGENR